MISAIVSSSASSLAQFKLVQPKLSSFARSHFNSMRCWTPFNDLLRVAIMTQVAPAFCLCSAFSNQGSAFRHSSIFAESPATAASKKVVQLFVHGFLFGLLLQVFLGIRLHFLEGFLHLLDNAAGDLGIRGLFLLELSKHIVPPSIHFDHVHLLVRLELLVVIIRHESKASIVRENVQHILVHKLVRAFLQLLSDLRVLEAKVKKTLNNLFELRDGLLELVSLFEFLRKNFPPWPALNLVSSHVAMWGVR
mmetsp:Transcript_5922/g.10754  ORF Transcript_5922/g.10754 Transcript_5922/m.10754 type:complete len:250 (+) Transcript_5922:433-1182(+)